MRFLNLLWRLSVFAATLAIILLITMTARGKTTHSPQTGAVTLNVADFGAVGNGVADNGPAFQSALDALAAAGGGTLLIPAGSYLIATPVFKDFAALPNGTITIQGVPSTTMPAPPTASGQDLSAGLNLTSQIIPATGSTQSAIKLTNLHQLLIEHVDFTGRPEQITDAYVSVYLNNIDQATIRHCEFYGISTFGVLPSEGGGNIIRAVQTSLSIELSVFLGCTANSGAYAPIVENLEWRSFSISNSIFIDYGQRTFFSKMGLGAPLSWINIAAAAAHTPDSPRRQFVIRDTFFDEGGWIGITATPHRWAPPFPTIDLVYISGLKMNVSNLASAGHVFYGVENILIENSHYGWSRNSWAAISVNGSANAILDNLTCIDHADRLHADNRTGRLTVINSLYAGIDSQAETTVELQTTAEEDPVQYVRRQFLTALGRQPDPAAHFYWSDVLIRCEQNANCLTEKRAALNQYLGTQPNPDFSLGGTVADENGSPLSDVAVNLTGTHSTVALTDSQGQFRFSSLPTSGSYTISFSKRHYTFPNGSQTFNLPPRDVIADIQGRLNRHSIGGRITRADGTAIKGVTLQLAQSPATTVSTDSNGDFSFVGLAAGQNYTVVPSLTDFAFAPLNLTFQDLSADQTANFAGTLLKFSLSGTVLDEDGDPLSGASISLTGSQSSTVLSDVHGNFQLTSLPTDGSYTVSVTKRHYSFATSSQSIVQPAYHVIANFTGRLNRHSIGGRITRLDGTGVAGVTLQLAQTPTITMTTDANGNYSFVGLAAGQNYTVVPSLNTFVFNPINTTFDDLSADRAADFTGKLRPQLMTHQGSDLALAFDSVTFTTQPFSISSLLGLNSDRLTRLILFATNFEPVNNPSQVSLVAEDVEGHTYPLEIEYIGDVEGQAWLKQVNVKLSPNLPNGSCLQLRLSVADVPSNNGRICIASSP